MVLLQAGMALMVEAVIGYPQYLVRAIGHPVIWIGCLMSRLDRRLNHPGPYQPGQIQLGDNGPGQRRAAGVLALVLLLAVTFTVAALAQMTLRHLPFGPFLPAIAASTLLAQRSLHDHVVAVASTLTMGGIASGRVAVSHIVGRDTDSLDEAGVCRAAIESLAENFSDGVVAPALWLAAGGLPCAAAYKAINTADSMIGHRTPRYEAFGWAAARLDDLVNLPASRLAALLLMVAAILLPGMDGKGAWRAVRRDASRHRSPNAGWPEAAMAGALGLALAGPRCYGGQLVPDAFMGRGRREATPTDIRRALRLYWLADAMLVGLILAAGLACGV